jgi:hypothetical protein
VRFFADKRDVDRNPRSVALAHAQPDRQPCAPADGRGSFDEAVTVDIQTLAILGEDEPVVLRLVEPQHRASHSWTFCLDARKIRIGCQFRRWHIGQSGNSPLRLMP